MVTIAATVPIALLTGTSATLAQMTPPLTQQQGTEISLNGRLESIPWRQWQDATGWRTQISDTGLRQMVGIDLLSTDDPGRQPIEWFTDFPTTPIVLSTQIDGEYRYLEISELDRSFGWQMETQGNTLYIESPPAQVTEIRQGEQPWGQRIVVDLDRGTPWQLDRQDDRWQIELDSSTSSGIRDHLPKSKLWTLEASGEKTHLFLNLPVSQTPRIFTLSHPDRLVIDMGADPIARRDILWMPGIRWRQQMVEVDESRFPVIWLEIDRHQSDLEFKPIWTNPDSQVGIAPLQEMAATWGAIAAVNAGFFNRNTLQSLGAIRRDDRWYSSPILHRGAIGWDEAGNVEIDRLTLQEELITADPQQIPLQYLNSGYAQMGASRYTSEWGKTYTPLSDDEILVVVEDDRVTQHIRGGKAGETPVPIPANGYLIAIRDDADLANSLPVGTQLATEQTTQPASFDRYPQILAAGPLLVKNSQIVLDALAEKFNPYFAKGRASRSAIGITKTGQFLLVIIRPDAKGRGATLRETAEMMQQLGAVDALNFDGGSSASLYLGGQLIDRVPRTAARVHNGLGIFLGRSSGVLGE
jgi:Phosphodiester glycosidase